MRYSLWDLLFEYRDMIRLFSTFLATFGFLGYYLRGGKSDFISGVIFTLIAAAGDMKASYYFPVIFISCMAYFLLGAKLFSYYASWIGGIAWLYFGYLNLRRWP